MEEKYLPIVVSYSSFKIKELRLICKVVIYLEERKKIGRRVLIGYQLEARII
jgi:hypothetical protein